MSDFFQNGTVTTFHNITDRPVEELEAELCRFGQKKPLGLILPSLYSELEGPDCLRFFSSSHVSEKARVRLTLSYNCIFFDRYVTLKVIS